MGKLFSLLLFLIIFFIFFLSPTDPDFGWHYRCGNNILEGKTPCIQNTFSYFLPDYQAYYSSFIFDTVTALVYNNFGFNGLSFLFAIVMTTVAYIYTRINKNPLLFSLIFFVIAVLLSWGTISLGWRPQMITLLFFMLAYYWLQHLEARKLLYLYPLLMIVWVNTHIGFFIGIILLGIWTAEKWVNFIRQRSKKNQQLILISTVILGLSFFATFINPFGYKVFIEIYRHTLSPLSNMIAEWVPSSIAHKSFVILLTCSIVVLSNLLDKKLTLFHYLLLVFVTVLIFTANRNLPYAYLIASSQLLYLFNFPHITNKNLPFFFPFLLALAISLIVVRVPSTWRLNTEWDTYCTKGRVYYPCVLLKNYPNLYGNIYAAYEYGGFLIWQKPEAKVFVDGRMPAWFDENGESPYKVYLDIIQTQPGWNEKLRELDTDFILIAQGTFLDLLLDERASEHGWEKVYEDKNHALYKTSY